MVKVSKATGAVLDWMVAYCLVFDAQAQCQTVDMGVVEAYSTNWEQGGPIMDRMMRDGLCLTGYTSGYPSDPTSCQAQIKDVVTGGPTPLIAAMRCYVASKLGDTVEVPKEIIHG